MMSFLRPVRGSPLRPLVLLLGTWVVASTTTLSDTKSEIIDDYAELKQRETLPTEAAALAPEASPAGEQVVPAPLKSERDVNDSHPRIRHSPHRGGSSNGSSAVLFGAAFPTHHDLAVSKQSSRPRVLPPVPGDEPIPCDEVDDDGYDTEHSLPPCGPERYCAPLSYVDSSTDGDDIEDDTSATASSHFCLHKTFLPFPLTSRDILALVLTVGCAFLSATAGIGGGGLVFPTIMLTLNLTPKEASVLSTAAVLGNTLAQTLLNSFLLRRRGNDGPKGGTGSGSGGDDVRGTILMVLPGLLAGASVAISMEGIVPGSVVLLLALSTLILAVVKTWRKAGGLREEERDRAAAAAERREEEGEGRRVDHADEVGGGYSPPRPSTEADRDAVGPTHTSPPATGGRGAEGHGRLPPWLTSPACSRQRSREHRRDVVASDDDFYDDGDEYSLAPSSSSRSVTWCCCRSLSYLCCCLRSDCKIEMLIFTCWAVNAATFLSLKEFIEPCTPAYFVIVFLPTVLAVGFVCVGRTVLRRERRKISEVPSSEGGLGGQDLWQSLREGGDGEENDLSQRAPLLGGYGGETSRDSQGGDRGDVNMVVEEYRGAKLVEYDVGLNAGEDSSTDTRPSGGKEFDNLVWWLPLASLVIGLLSALLGIGGGELLGPTLLLLNMDPRRSSAATAALSLLNSGTNALHYAVAGMIVSPGYAAVMAACGSVGGIFGRGVAVGIVARSSGGGSVIAYSLALVLAVAAGLVGYELASTEPEWSSAGVC